MQSKRAVEIARKVRVAMDQNDWPEPAHQAAATVIQSAFAEELAGMEAEIARLLRENRAYQDALAQARAEYE